MYLQWWTKILGHFEYLRGFHRFYGIGPENIYFHTFELPETGGICQSTDTDGPARSNELSLSLPNI